MPNYAQREQEVLTADQLVLTVKTRHPALVQLDDTALLDLIEALRDAKRQLDKDTSAEHATILAAAIRRADQERRKRGVQPRKPVATGTSVPLVKTGNTASPVKSRKPATSTRIPAGRKPSDTRKTDPRTEPHRVVVHPAKTSAPASTAAADKDIVTRKSTMTLTEAEKAAKQAARKAEKQATKVAEKEAAREARRAERKALKDAEKEEARLERRAARKAAKDAERQAAKQDERQAKKKAERKAARITEAAAAATAAPDEDTSAVEKQKSDKPKAAKGKNADQKKSK